MAEQERQFGEIDAEIFGSIWAWEDSLPDRHWVRSGGGWSSHSRKLCAPENDCTEIKAWPKPEAANGG